MKRKLCIAALAVAGMTACSPGGNVESEGEKELDTVAVVERVNEIYADALKQYNEFDSTKSWINSDSLYCTTDWNSWLARVKDYDAKHADGMVGFLEADYWVMGQDWGDLSVSDVKVTEMSDSTAMVQLNLHNLGNLIPVRLEMACEKGEWKIDNFIDDAHDVDWKAGMKEYLNEK